MKKRVLASLFVYLMNRGGFTFVVADRRPEDCDREGEGYAILVFGWWISYFPNRWHSSRRRGCWTLDERQAAHG